MINVGIVLFIIFIHWLADFHCQTHEMSMNKSKSNFWLTMHILVYTLVTFIFWNFFLLQPNYLYHIWDYIKIAGFIFTTHWITDYITSRMTSKLYAKGDFHNFFVVIGADQVLHYTQLLLAYYLFIY